MNFELCSQNQGFFTPHCPNLVNPIDLNQSKDLNPQNKSQKNQSLSEQQIIKSKPLILEVLHHGYYYEDIFNSLPHHQNYQAKQKTSFRQKTRGKKKFINIVSSQHYRNSKFESQNVLKLSNQTVDAFHIQENDIIQIQSTLSKRILQTHSCLPQCSFGYFDSCVTKQQQCLSHLIRQPGKQITKELSQEFNSLQFKEDDNRSFHFNIAKKTQLLALPRLMTKKRIHSQLTGQKIAIQDMHINHLRYCVGCEQPLLKAEINFHLQTCLQFQHVFHMTPSEIIKYLSAKIHQSEDQIIDQSQELLDTNTQRRNSQQKKLGERESFIENEMITSSYRSQQKYTIDFRQKWQRLQDKIHKANWFLKIRQRIRLQFKL